MRGKLVALVGALACVTAASLGAQNTIVFFASVVDDKAVPVATLAPDDLKVVENGAEGKITKVEPIDWPIKVQLLIDNGVGMDAALVQIRNGIKGFVEAMPDGIEMSLYTTAPQPRNIVRPTMDKKLMVQGADRIAPDSGAPRFIEALNEAASRIDKEKGNYFPVVVILGSMSAEGSSFNERDVQRMLQRFAERSTVHVIMLSTGSQSATRREPDRGRGRGGQEHRRPIREHRGRHPFGDAAARNWGPDCQESRAPEPSVPPDISTSKRRVGRHGADRRANPHRVELVSDDQRTAAVIYNPSDS